MAAADAPVDIFPHAEAMQIQRLSDALDLSYTQGLSELPANAPADPLWGPLAVIERDMRRDARTKRASDLPADLMARYRALVVRGDLTASELLHNWDVLKLVEQDRARVAARGGAMRRRPVPARHAAAPYPPPLPPAQQGQQWSSTAVQWLSQAAAAILRHTPRMTPSAMRALGAIAVGTVTLAAVASFLAVAPTARAVVDPDWQVVVDAGAVVATSVMQAVRQRAGLFLSAAAGQIIGQFFQSQASTRHVADLRDALQSVVSLDRFHVIPTMSTESLNRLWLPGDPVLWMRAADGLVTDINLESIKNWHVAHVLSEAGYVAEVRYVGERWFRVASPDRLDALRELVGRSPSGPAAIPTAPPSDRTVARPIGVPKIAVTIIADDPPDWFNERWFGVTTDHGDMYLDAIRREMWVPVSWGHASFVYTAATGETTFMPFEMADGIVRRASQWGQVDELTHGLERWEAKRTHPNVADGGPWFNPKHRHLTYELPTQLPLRRFHIATGENYDIVFDVAIQAQLPEAFTPPVFSDRAFESVGDVVPLPDD